MAGPTPLDDIAFLARSPHRVSVLDVLAEGPRTCSEIREVPVYRYDGTIPMMFPTADDVAILVPTDEHGMPGALTETGDEVIRAWVDDQFDAYRKESTELTGDDLPR